MKLINNFYAYLWPGVTMQEMMKYGSNCNSYVVANALPGNKHVLVDPGQVVNETRQNCLERLISEMKKDGIKIEDVGLILHTHAHPDHYGASEAIRKMSGAQVAIGRDDVFHSEQISPDFYLAEGELRLGKDLVATVILTPGHTPGHVSIYWPAEKVLMGGDLIFYGNIGRFDFGGSAETIKESIERVAELDIEYLLTGHQYEGPGIIQGKEQIKRNFEFIRRRIFPYL